MKHLLHKISSYKKVALIFSLLLGVGFSMLLPAQIVHAQATPITYDASKPVGPTNYNANNDAAACPDTPNATQMASFSGHGLGSQTTTTKNADGSTTTCNYFVAINTSVLGSALFQGGTITFPNNPNSIQINQTVAQDISSGNQTVTPVDASGKATGQSATVSGTLPGTCSFTDYSTWGNCVASGVARVALMFAGLAGYILGLVGTLFNWMVVITIFQFGSYFGNSAGLLTAWGILRDLGNILLLFGFIFMGILLILDLHTIEPKKAIPQLIIVAVLLNFSLFAAEAVIDVADVLSASIYSQAGQACTSADPSTCANSGIAGLVMNATGLNGVFSSANGFAQAFTDIGNDPTHQMVVYIGLTLFMAITAMVLLAGAIMLIIRAVVLVFIMVLAPLGFAAMVIPSFANLGKQWREQLISQAFFAPVYLLLILVSLKIMTVLKTGFVSNNGGTQATILTALSTPSTSYSTIFIFFALIIGFMIAAQMMAKKMGAVGADFASSVAKKTVQRTMTAPARVLGSVAGTYGYAPLVGGTANKLSKLQTSPGLGGKVARGLNVATGGGLQSALDKAQKSKPLGGYSYKEQKDLSDHAKHDAHVAALKGDVLKGLKTGTPADIDKMKTALNKMTDDEAAKFISGLSKDDAAKTATAFSTARFKKLIEHKEIGNAKGALVTGRYEEAREAINRGDVAAAKEAVKNYSAKELETIAANDQVLFDKMITAEDGPEGSSIIKESVLDELNKGDSLNSTQNDRVRAAKKVEKIGKILKSKAEGTLNQAEQDRLTALLNKTEPKKIATLSNEHLLRQEISAAINNQQKLAAIMAKDDGFENDAQKSEFLQKLDAAHPVGSTYRPDIERYMSGQAAQRFWGTSYFVRQPNQNQGNPPQQPPAQANPTPPQPSPAQQRAQQYQAFQQRAAAARAQRPRPLP